MKCVSGPECDAKFLLEVCRDVTHPYSEIQDHKK